jgi:hypothetical protein
VFLNEAAASARQPGAAKSAPDWVELYNQSLHAVDLSGYGLSDDPDRPRKWRFPSGTKIEAGGYLRVLLNGLDKADLSKNAFAANFKLSLSGRETLGLPRRKAAILDRMPHLTQYGGVSYGRISGRDGFFYLESATPGALNSQTPYQGRVESVSFSEPGGFYTGGVTVASLRRRAPMSATRWTPPSPSRTSPRYEGPIALSETTVLRARAFRDGMLPRWCPPHVPLCGAPHAGCDFAGGRPGGAL